jgi:hypothetical protein
MKKDSIGNELPEYIIDTSDLGKALAMNTFLLVCSSCIKSGNRVIYNSKTKTADIINKQGVISTVSHP